MNYQKWLQKQRSKSDNEKQVVAFFYASIITFVIFVIWVVTIVNTFDDKYRLLANSENTFEEVSEQSKGLFENFKNIFKK